MLHHTNGIIIHTTKYSDSSIISKILTRHFGLQTYMINGARSKKSKVKASLFQHLSIVDLIVTHAEKKTMQRISEINTAYLYTSIPFVFAKNCITLFINELLHKALREDEANQDLFDFIQHSLMILDLKKENYFNFHLCFMVQLTRYLGFYPQGKYSNTTPLFDMQEGSFVNAIPTHSYYLNDKQSKILNDLIGCDYETMQELTIDTSQRKQILQSLVTFYKLHIVSFKDLKSIEVLEEILS